MMDKLYTFLLRQNRFLFGITLVLGLLAFTTPFLQAQTIRYVRTTGTNTNPASATSWATATASLQGAINSLTTTTGGQVWTAAGTYKPGGNANTSRAVSFTLQTGVSVYGGFAGTETALSQRPVTFPGSTTLSGEIGSFSTVLDNSYHVLTNVPNQTPGTTLDGVVVVGGYADGNDSNGYGGGMLHRAEGGGFSFLTMTRCLFTNNFAVYGGAIATYAQSGVSSLTITNCTFDNNVASIRGGAIANGNVLNSGFPFISNSLIVADSRFLGNDALATVGEGGAVFHDGTNITTSDVQFARCFFNQNFSYVGGALSIKSASPTFSSCGFSDNYGYAGGVLNTLTGTPVFNNCSFTANRTATGTGGASNLIYGTSASAQLNNCVVFGNIGTPAFNGTLNVTATSSLFEATVTGYTGTGNLTTTTTPFSNTGTLATFPCTPVLNGSNATATTALLGTTDLAGNARIFGAAADLGAVEFPTIPPAVSAGTLSVNGATGTVLVCADAVIQSQTDGFTYRPYSWQSSVNGAPFATVANLTGPTLPLTTLISPGQTVAFKRLAYNCTGSSANVSPVITIVSPSTVTAGGIGGPPIVPYPQEIQLALTSLSAPTGVPAVTPLTLTWQQSENNTTWTDLPNSNSQTIGLPTISNDALPVKSFYFRRVTSVCSLSAFTAPVQVRVVPADGVIAGRVVSGDGFTPVASVTITAVRTTTGLAGSPGSMTYTTVSGTDGTYNISPIYYGVNSSISPTGSVTASTFVITPRYTDRNDGPPNSPTMVHVFSPASQTASLNQFTNPRTLTDFRDLTTFAISGQARQTCPDCITGLSGSTSLTGFIGCPVDSVVIKTFQGANQLAQTKTQYLNSPAPGDYGRFAATINNPGTYTLTATASKLVFVPASQTVLVSSNVYNLNFDSPTSQTIQGRVSAGCGEAIGQAVLEFTDVLKDASGNNRLSCFKKQVITNSAGYYQVVLPPRIYKVTALSLSPNSTAGIGLTDFMTFVNNLPADSLTRNLASTTAVVTLNVVYERPPTLAVEGLVSPAACGTASAFSVMEQSVPTPLTVKIYQGPVSKGCPVSGGLFTTTTSSGNSGSVVSTSGGSGSVVSTTGISGTLIVATNVQQSNGQTFRPVFVSGVANLTLLPSEPNIVAPYYRSFTVQFTDKFGRAATLLSRNIVLTGAKSGDKTFETVTPALPLFVLHDPPGDGSFSFREQSVVSSQSYKIGGSVSINNETALKIRLGVKALIGIGFATEAAFQVINNGSLDVGGSLGANNEWTFTTTTNSRIATSSQPGFTGDDADVVVGAAFNMFYSVATEISLTNSCSVTSAQVLAIAPDKVQTDYYTPVRTIRNQVIPNLQDMINLTPATDSVTRTDYASQISLWQQILTNNDKNKAEAKFESNKTFTGGGTQFSSSVASLSAQTYAVEYSTYLSAEVSNGLSLKVSGSEVEALSRIKIKVEVNGNTKGTSSSVVTTGYTLIDANGGDRFSVDVGRDPTYGTPVFRLLAGESSCPPEAKTRPRDKFEFSAPITVVSGVPAGGNAVFTLNMSNISEVITDPTRSATIELVAGSNPDNATIRINGSDYSGPVTYSLARLATLSITILIRQGNPNIYAYEGLKFKLSASCGGSSQIITLSAYFQNPCSNVTLVSPLPDWVTSIADNNSLPVLISGYTLANLTDVSLEYTPQGASSWQTGFTRTAAQLDNSPNGTSINWNTTGLTDGSYDLRLKLTCATGSGGIGTAYSTRASGIVDRTPPDLFGIPQPAGGLYVIGNTIGATYDEPLACSRIKNNNAPVLTRASTGQVIPATVGCSANQIVIVPAGSLAPFAGEVLSVTLTGIADVYGNIKTTPDIWTFQVSGPVSTTGLPSLSVTANNSSIAENATGAAQVVFRLPQNAANNTLINFSVAGTASFGVDYTTSYGAPGLQPLSATVNGAVGTIMIPAGASSVTLLIDPVADTRYETDETVVIGLLDGGDYGISAAASITATILNDDPASNQNIITSIKTGNWEDPETWDLVRTPLPTDEVILDQTHTVTLSTTGNAKKLTPRANARLRLAVPAAKLRLGF